MSELNGSFQVSERVEELYNREREWALAKFDAVVPANSLQMTGDFQLRYDITPLDRLSGRPDTLPISPRAFRQLMYRVNNGKLATPLMDSTFPAIGQASADFVNAILQEESFIGLQNGTTKQVLVRARGEIGEISGEVRCTASDRYTVFDNISMLAIVSAFNQELGKLDYQQYVEQAEETWGKGQVVIDEESARSNTVIPKAFNVRHTLDMISLDYVIPIGIKNPEGPGSQWPLAFIRNYENKGGSTQVVPGVRNPFCHNTARYHVQRSQLAGFYANNGWKPVIYKNGIKKEDFQYFAIMAMQESLGFGAELVKKARQLAYAQMDSASDLLYRIIGAVVPEDVQNRAAVEAHSDRGLGGRRSVMGVIDGLTAMANVENMPEDTADQLRAAGGTALATLTTEMGEDEWSREFARLVGADFALVGDED